MHHISNINEKINSIKNTIGLIQIYIEINKGKCINVKGILSFIKPWNL